jgi:hypothetical protein
VEINIILAISNKIKVVKDEIKEMIRKKHSNSKFKFIKKFRKNRNMRGKNGELLYIKGLEGKFVKIL